MTSSHYPSLDKRSESGSQEVPAFVQFNGDRWVSYVNRRADGIVIACRAGSQHLERRENVDVFQFVWIDRTTVSTRID